ncbi:MAG: DUF4974 domain-containing protein [Tannerellaceae bacterium]|jgi:ferric-dicitrate binding protein FerR (iron transport regulator)|nr:DUF4974 domain-containing protein [Tannerellaceae bacterium]
MKTLTDKTLLLAYLRDEASEDEKTVVEAWLKDSPENEAELLQLARLSHATQTYDRIMARNPMNAFKKMKRRIRRKRANALNLRIAAAAACIIAGFFLSELLSQTKASENYVQTVTLKTKAGMQADFDLPDGTKVYLNSGSELTYPMPYDKAERRVNLSGEAFFEVTENPEQPFTVSARDGEILVRALGTSFNVEAYNSDEIVNTTLLDGKVSISLKDNHTGKEHLACMLLPFEKAMYDVKDKTIEVKKANNKRETDWIKGVVSFKDTPLPEVLRKLSHYYDVSFEIKDPVIRTYSFTGTFDNRRLEHILEYLEISSCITYTIISAHNDDSEKVHLTKVILQKKRY